MNRRELFQTVAGIAAVEGVTLKASAVDADTKPVLALFESDRPCSSEMAARISTSFAEAMKGTPFEGVKALVLTEGLKLTLLDAHGRPCNRRLEDEPVDA